jgi:hypothetical protein
VAQLGARFHGMEEVIGSIPIRSTKYFAADISAKALHLEQLASRRQVGLVRELHFLD